MPRLVAPALALLLGPPLPADPADGPAELAKLRGTWVTHRSTRDGTASPAERGVRLVVDGDRLLVHEPGRKDPVRMTLAAGGGTVSVAPWADPADPGRPRVWPACALRLTYGRYRVAGDELTLVMQSAYSVPKDFSDRDQVRWVLRREPAK